MIYQIVAEDEAYEWTPIKDQSQKDKYLAGIISN